ncbi:BspA family leucine-rich repeat surface protein [Amedibacillus sp. YH-ame10]
MKKIVRSALLCIMAMLLVLSNVNIVLAAGGPVTSPDEKTSSANTSDDGNFTVTKNVKWTNETNTKGELEIKLIGETVTTASTDPKDIVFIADVSGSMSGDRLNYLKTALHDSADVLLDSKYDNRISLISFGSNATLEQGFTNNKTDFQAKASGIAINGFTEYCSGLIEAKNLIENRSDKSRKPVIVFMSDGNASDSKESIQSISDRLKSMEVEMYALQYMVGTDISSSIKALCSDEKRVYTTNKANHLNNLYSDVIQEIAEATIYKNVSLNLNLEEDNFKIDSVTSNYGTSNVVNDKIVWNIESLISKKEVVIKVGFSLQNSTYEGNLNVDKNSLITYDVETLKEIVLDDLAMNRKIYSISFESNDATSGEVPSQIEAINGSTVNIPGNEGNLSKTGEIFAGWQRTDTNEFINKTMVMPNKSIILRAIWAKPEIEMNTSTVGAPPIAMLKTGSLNANIVNGGIDKSVLRTITAIEFTHNAPSISDVQSDVSDVGNKSIIAYVNGTVLYIYSLGDVIAPSDSSYLFSADTSYGFDKVSSVVFNNMFKTDETTNMDGMFSRLPLTSIDLSSFNTSKVESMVSLFYKCNNLTAVSLEGLDTSNVTDMTAMFSSCVALKTVKLPSSDTSNLKKLSQLFTGCISLENVDFSTFNTSNVTSFDGMFSNCSSLVTLDVSNLDASKVTNLNMMFSGCIKLENLKMFSYKTSGSSLYSAVFKQCDSLKILDLSNFDTTSSWNMYTASQMFAGCTSITTAYAKTQKDADNFNSSYGKESNVNFIAKPAAFTLSEDIINTDVFLENKGSGISRAATGPVEVINGVADAGKINPSDVVDYDITVKYTGTTIGLKSGTMKVVNRLPENMTFVPDSFVSGLVTRITTGDGGDTLGFVKNQKVEGNVLTFDVIGLSPGAQIKVGYQATAPATPTDAYKEFLNQSSLTIEEVKTTSNYVRHYFGVPNPTAMFDVAYVYEGTVPTTAPTLPMTRTFTAGQSVNAVEVGLPGYKFSGWTSDEVSVNADGSFTMPNKMVTLKGSWTEIPAATSIKSKVTYEFKGTVPTDVEVPKEVEYTVGNNYNGVETITGKTISIAGNPTSAGYVFKGWTSDQLSADELTAGAFELGKDDVVITGTWEKEKFKVEYKYLETNPPVGAPVLPAPVNVAWGEEVVTKDKIDNFSTFGFDGWYSNNDIGADFKESFIMPQEDVTIYGYWNDLSTTYDVSYEYEGETPDDAPSLGTNDSAIAGNPSIVRIDPVSARGTDKNGVIGKWVFNGWESDDVTIATDGTFTMPNKNIKMKGSWKFEKNMNIRFVTFEIQNGTWSNGDTTDKVVTVELANGKTTLKDVDVPKGMYAKEGYTDGHWVVEPNTETDGITDSIKYTYKYVKKPVVTFKIEDGTWGDGSTANKNVDIELVKGKGSLSLMDVPTGMLAKNGYADGYWVVEPNTSKNAVTEDVVYTYRFKKEVHIVFKIINGTWKDGSSANKDIIVLLTDGKGTLKDTQVPVGMNAHKGYGNGKWVEVPNVKDGEVTGDVTYEYRYEALDTPGGIEPVNPDVTNPTKPGKSDTNSTNTGDTLDWKLPMVVLMVSGVFVVVAWKKRSKKEVE